MNSGPKYKDFNEWWDKTAPGARGTASERAAALAAWDAAVEGTWALGRAEVERLKEEAFALRGDVAYLKDIDEKRQRAFDAIMAASADQDRERITTIARLRAQVEAARTTIARELSDGRTGVWNGPEYDAALETVRDAMDAAALAEGREKP